MTDNVNISYSFQSNSTTEPPKTGPLVAFADCELIRVDETMALVINRQNGQQQLLAPGLVDALTYCTHFRSIDDHASWLAQNRPELQGNVEAARSTLQQLDQAGMLLRADHVVDRLRKVETCDVAPTRVFVITCDRPRAVERLLDSLLATPNLAQHNALVLVDDSRDSGNQIANRELVARFNTRSATEMLYFGDAAQSELLYSLISELPDHEMGIRFLLDRDQWGSYRTYGRSRTLSLLLSVGYRAIVLDDDILCEAILPPIREDGLGFGGGARKAAFFQDAGAMQQHMERAPFDALSGHASLLGHSLGNAIHELSGELNAGQLQGVNATLANVLDPAGRVLITQCGSWGDPGTGGAHWALNLGEDSVARLITAPHGMSAALESRYNWLGSSRPNIVKMAFMSQMTGVDNSQLLPPYFTAFRGEDMLFGAMVEHMHHNATTLEYAWGVPHLPMDERPPGSLREPIAAKGGIALLARHLTDMIDYDDAANPDQKLQRLAQEAQRLSERSTENLLYDYRAELARGHADQLRSLRAQLTRANELPSETWKGYLERGAQEVQQALAAIHQPTELTDSSDNREQEALVEEFRWMASGYGAALAGWDVARAACQTLAEGLISQGSLRP